MASEVRGGCRGLEQEEWDEHFSPEDRGPYVSSSCTQQEWTCV